MMWDVCLPHVFTLFIWKIIILFSVAQIWLNQKADNIVKRFIEQDIKNIDVSRTKIKENFKIIHCIYLLLYPKIYNRVNHFGIQNKTQFEFVFSNWRAKKHTGMIS